MTWLLLLALAQAAPIHEACKQCHTEPAADVESHPHFAKNISCDTCHGPSEKHRAASGHVAPDRIATREAVPPLCGTCHPTQLKSYQTSKHWTALQASTKSPQCATCHGNHALRSAKAIETSCSRCHTTRPAACAATPNQTAKVTCAGCHTPHGFSKVAPK
ncbi:MAG: hypothetical protein FJW36_23285 [Acidobacteria bacterium]|nr:hypothetical protein [Acidobacteriota bacterium]